MEVITLELSPEEKRRIYEEEKAKIEAEEQAKQKGEKVPDTTSTGLSPKIAGLLSYLGWWISGLIFYILEQKNSWVRFHAAQSIIVFGTITVAGSVLHLIPMVGNAFSSIVWIIGFIFWIILMVKAYSGERYKLGLAGDIAERMVTLSGVTNEYKEASPDSVLKVANTNGGAERANTSASSMDKNRENVGKVKEYVKSRRSERTTTSAFAIAWSIVLLVFFYFFRDYIAYYSSETLGREVVWTRQPFFTNEIDLWLPILTVTLVASIIGHIILLIFDKYILREVINIAIDALGLVTVITLLSVFPFDFSVIPGTAITIGVQVGVKIILILVSIAMGIGIMVRIIKLIVNLARGIWSYQEGA
jgi:uncharacterized membrane protein